MANQNEASKFSVISEKCTLISYTLASQVLKCVKILKKCENRPLYLSSETKFYSSGPQKLTWYFIEIWKVYKNRSSKKVHCCYGEKPNFIEGWCWRTYTIAIERRYFPQGRKAQDKVLHTSYREEKFYNEMNFEIGHNSYRGTWNVCKRRKITLQKHLWIYTSVHQNQGTLNGSIPTKA